MAVPAEARLPRDFAHVESGRDSGTVRPMWLTATLFVAAALAGCSGGDPPLECNMTVTPTCAPLYQPTFDNVYSMTLMPHCGSGTRSCHSDAGMKGGMSFQTIDQAYDA